MGGAVPIVNIDGVKAGDLALDGAILAKIFLGEIKSWNYPAIQRLNPYAGCPRSRSWRCIAPTRPPPRMCSPIISARSARTGRTRSAPTSRLNGAAVSARKVMTGSPRPRPRCKGAIGYAEYAIARHGKLAFVRMVNRDGRAVAPTPASLMAAAANANWEATPGFGVILTDMPGAGCGRSRARASS